MARPSLLGREDDDSAHACDRGVAQHKHQYQPQIPMPSLLLPPQGPGEGALTQAAPVTIQSKHTVHGWLEEMGENFWENINLCQATCTYVPSNQNMPGTGTVSEQAALGVTE